MIFRYNFGSKIDLSKFKKQADHYIRTIPSINYHLFVSSYKLVVDINKEDFGFSCKTVLFDIKRDSEGEVSDSSVIIPLNDVRFKDLRQIVSVYDDLNHIGHFSASNPEDVSQSMCNLVKLLYKLNALSAFL